MDLGSNWGDETVNDFNQVIKMNKWLFKVNCNFNRNFQSRETACTALAENSNSVPNTYVG